MHRFFLTEKDILSDGEVILRQGDVLHQWKHVLRFKEGEEIELMPGDGRVLRVSLRELAESRTYLDIKEVIEPGTELPVRLVLAQAFLKNVDRFEMVLQKGVELGVSEFVPIITERTQKRMEPKRERWEKILKEAAEQSGRTVIPILAEPMSLDAVVADRYWVCLPHIGDDVPLTKLVSSEVAAGEVMGVKEMVVCIGPEGGFSEEEVGRAKEMGAHIVSLGPRVLRAETAGIVAAALIADVLDTR